MKYSGNILKIVGISWGKGTLRNENQNEVQVLQEHSKYHELDGRSRVCFLRIDKPNEPCLKEIRKPYLPEDKIWVQELNLISKLFRMNLAKLSLSFLR